MSWQLLNFISLHLETMHSTRRSMEQALRMPINSNWRYGLNPAAYQLKTMNYGHPQAMPNLNRPLVHPMLLQHLLQRQFDFRSELAFSHLLSCSYFDSVNYLYQPSINDLIKKLTEFDQSR